MTIQNAFTGLLRAASRIVGSVAPAGNVYYVKLKTDQDYTQFYTKNFHVNLAGQKSIHNTLLGAIGACNANAGDQILVCAGFTGNISSATALAINKAGIRLIGLGVGNNRPIITVDTGATSTIVVSAANVLIQNFIFVANFAAIASLFTLTTAKDFQLLNCEFRDTSSVLNFDAIVTTDTTSNDADGLTIQGCMRIGAGADSNTTIISMLGTNDRLYVQGNYFAHAATTTGGLMIIATGKIVTNARILDNICNFVASSGANTGLLITTNGSTNSGIVGGNFVQALDATSPILVTASSGFIYSKPNWYTHTADKSGYALPPADS